MARPGTAGRGVHRPYDANELRAAALVAPSCRTRRAETLGLLTVDSEVAVIGRRPASAAALRGSESLPALMHPPVSYTPQRSTTPTFARAGGRSSPQLMAPFWEPPPRPQTASVSAAEVALAQQEQVVEQERSGPVRLSLRAGAGGRVHARLATDAARRHHGELGGGERAPPDL